MDLGGFQALVTDALHDRIEQRGCLTRRPRERRAVDINALCRHHLGLAIERQVVVEFADDDMRASVPKVARRRTTALAGAGA